MDFDTVKENIQPLRQGRNVERLETALNAENEQALQKELEKERLEHEMTIQNYKGLDPLEAWYEYISWIEQSYPKSGKESQLDDVLIRCITTFENDDRYRQDRRMVKIYMKYIDTQDKPQEFYQELYNQGVGTMVADLYIGWAYYYDAIDNFKKAEEIFRKGLDARAQPFDELNHAHKQFMVSVSQRILYKDEPSNHDEFRSSLEDRRSALTSLRAHRKRFIGTTRTGLAVKNELPGRVRQDVAGSSRAIDENNVPVQVYKEENDEHNSTVPRNESIVKSLVDSARARENKHEPGPWNKAKLGSKNGPLIAEQQKLDFKIMEDDTSFTPIPYTEKTYQLGFLPPPGFVSKNTRLPGGWENVQIVIPEPVSANSIPMYSKMYCYPGNNQEYSAEEVQGYRWFKSRKISNKFTLKYDPIWDEKYECGIRLHPNFVTKSLPQSEMEYVQPMLAEAEKGFTFNYESLKTLKNGVMEEKSNEELMAEKWKLNPKKYTGSVDMDVDELEETMIGERRMSVMPRYSSMPGRKSVFPERAQEINHQPPTNSENNDFKVPQTNLRKSILPRKSIMPVPSQLSPIKDASGAFEDTFGENKLELSKPEPPPTIGFQIFQDDAPPDTDSALQKRKLETSVTEIIPNKNVCAIETPLKFRTSTTTADEKFDDFVVPKPKSPTKSLLPFPIFEDEVVQKEEELPIASHGFTHNDSMCTINFNQCLDKGSVSTPIQNKTAKRVEFLEKMQAIEDDENSPTTNAHDAENAEAPAYAYQTLPKQLSTIMETTETTSSTVSNTNTKSSIDSPESDNETALRQKSVIENKSELTAPPIQLKADVSSVACKEKTIVIPAFSIYEDKTENMKAVTLKDPTFPLPNDSKIDKENNSKIISPSMATESFKIPETSGFMVYEDKKSSIAVDSMNSMMSLKITDDTIAQEISASARSESSRKTCLKPQNESVFTAYDDDKLIPSNNSMVSFQVPVDISVKDDAKPGFQIYQDQSGAGNSSKSMKASDDRLSSSKDQLTLEKSEDNTLKAASDSRKQLISFESSTKQSAAAGDSTMKPETTGRKSDDFYDFFVKSPVKPTRPTLFSNIHMSPKSKEISSLLKFDSSERDATQALVKLNLNDSKNVSMLERATKSNAPILTPSQIKQEPSLHIEDTFRQSRASTNSPVYQMTPEKASEQGRKPIFVEDDNINTINFVSNLGSNQNSTFIAKNSISPDKIGFKVSGTQPATRKRNESIEFEDFMTIASEKPMPVTPRPAKIYSKNFAPKPSTELMPPPAFNQPPVASSKAKVKDVFVHIPPIQNQSENTDLGMSIYVKDNNDVEVSQEDWDEVQDDFDVNANGNNYIHNMVDFNATQHVIDEHFNDDVFNPFDKNLLNAFLEKVDLLNYLEKQKSCTLKNKILPLSKGQTINIAGESFDVLKTIGKGGYGTIFCGKSKRTGKLYALKQERPANLWEYYICLELNSRITNKNILHGFMSVECALIGSNASILVSEFSKYGNLIDVCNKVKTATTRNMDELIVMILTCQILDIMDHLHGNHIIHADIKPDNFLFLCKLEHNSVRPAIQLIDFGISIDMSLIENYQPGVQFTLVSDDDPCIEMRENKPWTYQVDLYGVAGTVHAMLFGKYMEVEKKLFKWDIKTKLPRYFQKDLWENFFNSLLNIRSCKEMPNLQSLKHGFKEELENKERIVREKIYEFNMILTSN